MQIGELVQSLEALVKMEREQVTSRNPQSLILFLPTTKISAVETNPSKLARLTQSKGKNTQRRIGRETFNQLKDCLSKVLQQLRETIRSTKISINRTSATLGMR